MSEVVYAKYAISDNPFVYYFKKVNVAVPYFKY